MYIYNYRIFDKHQNKVVSIAVLIDNDKSFRPDSFTMEQFGCEINFKFPIIKLLDYEGDDQLANNNNPFAIITRVQLTKHETEKDVDNRYLLRMGLTQELYKHGYSKEQVVRLYRFIDYILTLPKPLAIKFKKELEQFEESLKMPYVTSTEMVAREEQAQEDILEILEIRFGNTPYPTQEKVKYCDDLNKLKRAHRKALLVKSLDEFKIL
jgi:hypothetical protein